MNKHEFGKLGQDVAKRYLQHKGYEFLAEHFNGTRGEIDLIFKDGDQIVFVEVKTRSSERQGTAFEAISFSKRRKLFDTALEYLEQNGINTDNFRIDGIGVVMGDAEPQIRQWMNIR